MDPDQALENLKRLRNKRGYLLPHHGLMAVSAPDLLDAYDELYTALALTPRHLSRYQHEFVWLGVLIVCHEELGTHHIQRFRDAGGRDADLANALAIASIVTGCNAYHFVAAHWKAHLPGLDPQREYLDTFNAIAKDTPPALAHLTACAANVCTANWQALDWHIQAAYKEQASELALSEALSLAMFPGSVPNYVEAAEVWRALILSRKVEASEPFKAWARMSGQGGFDEASGIRTPD